MHTGEGTVQKQVVSIGEYGATDVLGGYTTRGTDLYHHDTLLEGEWGLQGHCTGGGDMEDDPHYHKHPPQNDRLSA